MEPLNKELTILLKTSLGRIYLAKAFADMLDSLAAVSEINEEEIDSVPVEKRSLTGKAFMNRDRSASIKKAEKIGAFIEENGYSEKDIMIVAFFYNMGLYGKKYRDPQVEEQLKNGDKLILLRDMEASLDEVLTWEYGKNILYWAYQKQESVSAKRIYDGINLVKEYFNELSEYCYLWEE